MKSGTPAGSLANRKLVPSKHKDEVDLQKIKPTPPPTNKAVKNKAVKAVPVKYKAPEDIPKTNTLLPRILSSESLSAPNIKASAIDKTTKVKSPSVVSLPDINLHKVSRDPAPVKIFNKKVEESPTTTPRNEEVPADVATVVEEVKAETKKRTYPKLTPAAFPINGLKYELQYKSDVDHLISSAKTPSRSDSPVSQEEEAGQNLNPSLSFGFKVRGIDLDDEVDKKKLIEFPTTVLEVGSGNKKKKVIQNTLKKRAGELFAEIDKAKTSYELDEAINKYPELKDFINKFNELNKDAKSSAPMVFYKYALQRELRLISAQVVTLGKEGNHRFKDEMEDFVQKKLHAYQEALDEGITYPQERFKEQVLTKFTAGSLNVALMNPSVKPFKSKMSVEITDTLSSDQVIALEGIDNAIFRSGDKGGKAEVRIATGGGKSHLTRIIEQKYKGDKITQVKTLDLNSPEKDLAILQGSAGKKDLAKVLIQLDEAYFYGKSNLLNPTSEDLQKIEEERNDLIKNLRNCGATVIVFGASESPTKIAIEIERIKSKIEVADGRLDDLREAKKGRKEDIRAVGNAVKFYKDIEKFSDRAKRIESVVSLIKELESMGKKPTLEDSEISNLRNNYSSHWIEFTGGFQVVSKFGSPRREEFFKNIINSIRLGDAGIIGRFKEIKQGIEQEGFDEDVSKAWGGRKDRKDALINHSKLISKLAKTDPLNLSNNLKIKALEAEINKDTIDPGPLFKAFRKVVSDPELMGSLNLGKHYDKMIGVQDEQLKDLRFRRDVKISQFKDIRFRRDEKTQERFDRATEGENFVKKDQSKHHEKASLFDLIADNLPVLVSENVDIVGLDGNVVVENRIDKMQYVLPDFDINETTCGLAQLQQIQGKTQAEIIIIPYKNEEDGKGLQCRVYHKVDDVETYSEPMSFDELGTFMKRNSNKTVLSFFDQKNAIGGDYGDAGLNVTHQYIHVKSKDGLTRNRIMQANRDRTPVENGAPDLVERKFIIHENIDLVELKAAIDKNTEADDRAHAEGYLLSKISEAERILATNPTDQILAKAQEQKARYTDYLSRLDEVLGNALDDVITQEAADAERDAQESVIAEYDASVDKVRASTAGVKLSAVEVGATSGFETKGVDLTNKPGKSSSLPALSTLKNQPELKAAKSVDIIHPQLSPDIATIKKRNALKIIAQKVAGYGWIEFEGGHVFVSKNEGADEYSITHNLGGSEPDLNFVLTDKSQDSIVISGLEKILQGADKNLEDLKEKSSQLKAAFKEITGQDVFQSSVAEGFLQSVNGVNFYKNQDDGITVQRTANETSSEHYYLQNGVLKIARSEDQEYRNMSLREIDEKIAEFGDLFLVKQKEIEASLEISKQKADEEAIEAKRVQDAKEAQEKERLRQEGLSKAQMDVLKSSLRDLANNTKSLESIDSEAVAKFVVIDISKANSALKEVKYTTEIEVSAGKENLTFLVKNGKIDKILGKDGELTEAVEADILAQYVKAADLKVNDVKSRIEVAKAEKDSEIDALNILSENLITFDPKFLKESGFTITKDANRQFDITSEITPNDPNSLKVYYSLYAKNLFNKDNKTVAEDLSVLRSLKSTLTLLQQQVIEKTAIEAARKAAEVAEESRKLKVIFDEIVPKVGDADSIEYEVSIKKTKTKTKATVSFTKEDNLEAFEMSEVGSRYTLSNGAVQRDGKEIKDAKEITKLQIRLAKALKQQKTALANQIQAGFAGLLKDEKGEVLPEVSTQGYGLTKEADGSYSFTYSQVTQKFSFGEGVVNLDKNPNPNLNILRAALDSVLRFKDAKDVEIQEAKEKAEQEKTKLLTAKSQELKKAFSDLIPEAEEEGFGYYDLDNAVYSREGFDEEFEISCNDEAMHKAAASQLTDAVARTDGTEPPTTVLRFTNGIAEVMKDGEEIYTKISEPEILDNLLDLARKELDRKAKNQKQSQAKFDILKDQLGVLVATGNDLRAINPEAADKLISQAVAVDSPQSKKYTATINDGERSVTLSFTADSSGKVVSVEQDANELVANYRNGELFSKYAAGAAALTLKTKSSLESNQETHQNQSENLLGSFKKLHQVEQDLQGEFAQNPNLVIAKTPEGEVQSYTKIIEGETLTFESDGQKISRILSADNPLSKTTAELADYRVAIKEEFANKQADLERLRALKADQALQEELEIERKRLAINAGSENLRDGLTALIKAENLLNDLNGDDKAKSVKDVEKADGQALAKCTTAITKDKKELTFSFAVGQAVQIKNGDAEIEVKEQDLEAHKVAIDSKKSEIDLSINQAKERIIQICGELNASAAVLINKENDLLDAVGLKITEVAGTGKYQVEFPVKDKSQRRSYLIGENSAENLLDEDAVLGISHLLEMQEALVALEVEIYQKGVEREEAKAAKEVEDVEQQQTLLRENLEKLVAAEDRVEALEGKAKDRKTKNTDTATGIVAYTTNIDDNEVTFSFDGEKVVQIASAQVLTYKDSKALIGRNKNIVDKVDEVERAALEAERAKSDILLELNNLAASLDGKGWIFSQESNDAYLNIEKNGDKFTITSGDKEELANIVISELSANDLISQGSPIPFGLEQLRKVQTVLKAAKIELAKAQVQSNELKNNLAQLSAAQILLTNEGGELTDPKLTGDASQDAPYAIEINTANGKEKIELCTVENSAVEVIIVTKGDGKIPANSAEMLEYNGIIAARVAAVSQSAEASRISKLGAKQQAEEHLAALKTNLATLAVSGNSLREIAPTIAGRFISEGVRDVVTNSTKYSSVALNAAGGSELDFVVYDNGEVTEVMLSGSAIALAPDHTNAQTLREYSEAAKVRSDEAGLVLQEERARIRQEQLEAQAKAEADLLEEQQQRLQLEAEALQAKEEKLKTDSVALKDKLTHLSDTENSLNLVNGDEAAKSVEIIGEATLTKIIYKTTVTQGSEELTFDFEDGRPVKITKSNSDAVDPATITSEMLARHKAVLDVRISERQQNLLEATQARATQITELNGLSTTLKKYEAALLEDAGLKITPEDGKDKIEFSVGGVAKKYSLEELEITDLANAAPLGISHLTAMKTVLEAAQQSINFKVEEAARAELEAARLREAAKKTEDEKMTAQSDLLKTALEKMSIAQKAFKDKGGFVEGELKKGDKTTPNSVTYELAVKGSRGDEKILLTSSTISGSAVNTVTSDNPQPILSENLVEYNQIVNARVEQLEEGLAHLITSQEALKGQSQGQIDLMKTHLKSLVTSSNSLAEIDAEAEKEFIKEFSIDEVSGVKTYKADINLPGPKVVEVSFVIDENGEITEISAGEPKVLLAANHENLGEMTKYAAASEARSLEAKVSLQNKLAEKEAEDAKILESQSKLEDLKTSLKTLITDSEGLAKINPEAVKSFITKGEENADGIIYQAFISSGEPKQDVTLNFSYKDGQVTKVSAQDAEIVADATNATSIESHKAGVEELSGKIKNKTRLLAAIKIESVARTYLQSDTLEKAKIDLESNFIDKSLIEIFNFEQRLNKGSVKTVEPSVSVDVSEVDGVETYKTTISKNGEDLSISSNGKDIVAVTKADGSKLDEPISSEMLKGCNQILKDKLAKLVKLNPKKPPKPFVPPLPLQENAEKEVESKYSDVKTFAYEKLEEIQKDAAFEHKLDRAVLKIVAGETLTTLDKNSLIKFYNKSKAEGEAEIVDKTALDAKGEVFDKVKALVLDKENLEEVKARVESKKFHSAQVHDHIDKTVLEAKSHSGEVQPSPRDIKGAVAIKLRDKVLGLNYPRSPRGIR